MVISTTFDKGAFKVAYDRWINSKTYLESFSKQTSLNDVKYGQFIYQIIALDMLKINMSLFLLKLILKTL